MHLHYLAHLPLFIDLMIDHVYILPYARAIYTHDPDIVAYWTSNLDPQIVRCDNGCLEMNPLELVQPG